MKRKIFGILLTLVLAVTGFGLVGCGGGNTPAPAPGPGPEPGPEVTYDDDTTPVSMEDSVFLFSSAVDPYMRGLGSNEEAEDTEDFEVAGELCVVGLKEMVGEIVVPAYVIDEDENIYRVTQLGDGAFQLYDEILLSSNIEDLEEDILVKVTIPSTVEFVYDYAFEGCTSLQEIILNNRETVIENLTYALENLLSEFMDEGYTREEVFELMNAEAEEDGLLYLGNPQNPYMYLFSAAGEPYYYESPDEFVYPDGAVDTTNGVEVTINENCLIIGEFAFASTSVTQVNLPEGLLAIGRWAFNGCYDLEELEIPASVKQIGYGIVNYRTNLYVDSENLVEKLSNLGTDPYVLKTIVDEDEELYTEYLGEPNRTYNSDLQDWVVEVYTHNNKEYYRYFVLEME